MCFFQRTSTLDQWQPTPIRCFHINIQVQNTYPTAGSMPKMAPCSQLLIAIATTCILCVHQLAAQATPQTLQVDSRSDLRARTGLTEECRRLSKQRVVRPRMQECSGFGGDPTLRGPLAGLELPEPGIESRDCLNGCFARVIPGPNKLCLCMNGTAVDTCFKGGTAFLLWFTSVSLS